MNECIICGSDDFMPLYSDTLKKCSTCGFVTANMNISPELLKETYSINYFKGEEYLDYLKDKQVLQLNFEKRILLIEKLIKKGLPISNCLEIGCAYGFFGDVLKKHSNANYKGIDIVPEAIAYGREDLKLDLIDGDYLDLAKPAEPYTDVFMWDVIEHLQYPGLFLKKSYQELAPGGRIYITTGDIGAVLPRIQGKNWRMIHPPSHLHYFTKENLSVLLKKYGFTVHSIKYLPVYRSLRQIFYSLLMLKSQNRKLEKLLSGIPSNWTISLNTFDILFMIAEK